MKFIYGLPRCRSRRFGTIAGQLFHFQGKDNLLGERISLTAEGIEPTQAKSFASGEFEVLFMVSPNCTCEFIGPIRYRASTVPVRPKSDSLPLGRFGRMAIEGGHMLFEDLRGLFRIGRVRQLLAEQMMLGELADAA